MGTSSLSTSSTRTRLPRKRANSMKKRVSMIWMDSESTTRSAPPFYTLLVPEGQVRFEFQSVPVLKAYLMTDLFQFDKFLGVRMIFTLLRVCHVAWILNSLYL